MTEYRGYRKGPNAANVGELESALRRHLPEGASLIVLMRKEIAGVYIAGDLGSRVDALRAKLDTAAATLGYTISARTSAHYFEDGKGPILD